MKVTLIAAQSLDGFITFHGVPGSAFTSAADKQYFSRALGEFDCRVMGAGTYRTAREITRRAAAQGALTLVVTRNPEAFAADVLPGQLEFTAQQPPEILAALSARHCSRCALIGGSEMHAVFLKAGAVDELWLTIEPRLFGKGKPLVGGALDVKLELLSNEALSAQTLLLKYRVLKP
jgi:dihydrofolate reductase